MIDFVPPQPHAELTKIKSLFLESKSCKELKDMAGGRRIEKQVARLVSRIAANEPFSRTHAEAQREHHYVLLCLAATSNRKKIAYSLRNAAYDLAASSLRIEIAIPGKPEFSTIFNASNLALDLIHTENRPAEGLHWMLVAKSLLLKLANKKKLPTRLLSYKLFDVDYGIAKAHFELGNLSVARKLLAHALALVPRLGSITPYNLEEATDLLARIRLAEHLSA